MSELERLQKAYDAAEEAARKAGDARHAAKKALDAEKGRLAAEGVGAPYPLGTKLRCKRGRLAGTFGLLEARTSESRYASTPPAPGNFYVRLLKKDGTPGLRHVGGQWYDNDVLTNWEPVK